MTTPKHDITIYQGASFRQPFYLNNGLVYSIRSVEPGISPRIVFSTPHDLVSGDRVQLIDFEAIPSPQNNLAAVSSASNDSITINTEVNLFRDKGKSKVARATDITGYTFKGEIRQNRVSQLGIVASVQAASNEVLIQGRNNLQVGDSIILPNAGFTESSPGLIIQVFRSPSLSSSVIRVSQNATADVTNEPISVATSLLTSFNFNFVSSVGGLIEGTLTASDTEGLPITADNDDYFYDIKYEKPDNTVGVLLYGRISIIPQVTQLPIN